MFLKVVKVVFLSVSLFFHLCTPTVHTRPWLFGEWGQACSLSTFLAHNSIFYSISASGNSPSTSCDLIAGKRSQILKHSRSENGIFRGLPKQGLKSAYHTRDFLKEVIICVKTQWALNIWWLFHWLQWFQGNAEGFFFYSVAKSDPKGLKQTNWEHIWDWYD